MRTALLNDVKIAYDDTGSGDPVLLVHGHPFNRSMWAPQIEAIARSKRRAVTFDLRGYGESEVVAGVTPLGLFADDIVALLDHLSIDSATVVGLSMGGQIVMDLFARFPDRVAAVVLADTFPDAETAVGITDRMDSADNLIRNGMSRYSTENISKMVGPTTMLERPAVVEHVTTMMLNTPPAGAAAALRGRALRREYATTLQALSVPALIVVGRDDEFTPVADAERMHDLIADSRLVIIDDTGHLPNLERPDSFNAAFLDFLNETGVN